VEKSLETQKKVGINALRRKGAGILGTQKTQNKGSFKQKLVEMFTRGPHQRGKQQQTPRKEGVPQDKSREGQRKKGVKLDPGEQSKHVEERVIGSGRKTGASREGGRKEGLGARTRKQLGGKKSRRGRNPGKTVREEQLTFAKGKNPGNHWGS